MTCRRPQDINNGVGERKKPPVNVDIKVTPRKHTCRNGSTDDNFKRDHNMVNETLLFLFPFFHDPLSPWSPIFREI